MSKSLYYGNPINRSHPLNRGLVSRWKVVPWYASGPRLIDLAAQNHGTLTNYPTWSSAAGRPGGSGSLKFDGSDDYVNAGSSSTISLQSSMTFSGWFKANGDYTTAQALIASSISGALANYAVTFGFTDNKFEFWISSGGPSITSALSISDDKWHHYAATRAGVTSVWTLNLYIDGLLDKTDTTNINPTDTASATVSIGRFGGFSGYYVNGLIDDVRLYNRSLAADEVSAVYNCSTQQYDPTLNWIESRAMNAAAAAAQQLQDLAHTPQHQSIMAM